MHIVSLSSTAQYANITVSMILNISSLPLLKLSCFATIQLSMLSAYINIMSTANATT